MSVVQETQEQEIIPSKTGVFRRIKMKLQHKSRSPITNVVRKAHVTHQGVLIRGLPVPISPSSKKRRAEGMAKPLSKKKKKKTRKMVISIESTDDEDERILETPEANLHKDTSTPT